MINRFPDTEIRKCQACHLPSLGARPVPGDGPIPSDVFFLAQNPGKNEDIQGRPLVGQSGRLFNQLLKNIGCARELCFVSNLIKCLTPSNKEPSPDCIQACSHWLDIELGLVQPKIIILMGVPACRRFGFTDTMEHMHGKPIVQDNRIYLPCYHPAAALHDTAQLRQLYDDFQVLKGLLSGEDPESFIVKDKYPNPVYTEITTEAEMLALQQSIADVGLCAADVETVNDKLWSVQVSIAEGSGYFIGGELAHKFRFPPDAEVVLHFYLNDIKFVKVGKFCDSMVMAYLCGQSQGLKDLGNRLCGVKMKSYHDLVAPYGKTKAVTYLNAALSQEWPPPEPVVESFWDNKAGKVIQKSRKPQPIDRKMKRILADCEKDAEVDPYERWQHIDESERSAVEDKLGVMPEADMNDVPHDLVVDYAVRDADITLRVHHILLKQIQELDLEFVLRSMDLGILPMVQEMMDNGMALDIPRLKQLSSDYTTRMAETASELATLAGKPFNPNSSAQVADVVYGDLKFPITKKTATGLISTDDQELKKVKHPIVKGILKYRGMSKLRGTYADNLVDMSYPDSLGVTRIHTILKTTRVETGRLSSSEPNLQNIPTRSKDGKDIKRCFVAAPGKRMLEADYSQIEMRCQAHLAQDPVLIELFLRGGDPHTEEAAHTFGIDLETAKQEKYRYPIKRLNFGVIYGIGAPGLANQIQEYISDLEMEGTKVDVEPWTEEQCQQRLDEWYAHHPAVRDYQLEKVAEARRFGYVSDMFGRIRFVPEVYCPIESIQEAGARQAANMPVTACLPADTRITTKSGWLPIGEFKDGMEVWTGERWATATRLTMGSYPRVRLFLSDGRTFDCDTNHKLLVNAGTPWPDWKNVLAIEPTDNLVQDWSTDWGLSVGSEEDWYWAGRFTGDGWLSSPTAKIRFWGMAFGSKEVQDGDRLMSWLGTKNIRGQTNSKTGYYYEYDHHHNFRIKGGTQAGYTMWQSLGMLQKKAKEKRIPLVVFTLDYARRLAFLNGYTDADGRSNRRGWQLCSASHELIMDTVRLAETLGFSAWIRAPQTRTYDWPSAVGRGAIVTSTLWYCDILKNRKALLIEHAEIMEPEPMFTLSVDDERHAFASEGLISKNSAQGIIKCAMVELMRDRRHRHWEQKVRFNMQIHDSLIVEINDNEDEAQEVGGWMKKIMCGVVKLCVPVDVDIKQGVNWAETSKLKLEEKK